ncbi:MAG TPA: oxidoreductase [Mycobacterium sp.]|nr:oxidoreductase [Mycobacterium sp.]
MGLFDKLRSRADRPADGTSTDLAYLRAWVTQHNDVEGFVEPKTTVLGLTVVLVAADGEWTRRRVGTERDAMRLSDWLGIPVYDVEKVGYPQRMRDFDARRRIERRRALHDELTKE